MSGQLESERQIFERRIQDLIDQQDRISTERESMTHVPTPLSICIVLFYQ